MAKRKRTRSTRTCKTLVTILKDDTKKLAGRFVMVPKLPAKDQKGAKQFAEVILQGLKTECACPVTRTKNNINKGFDFYKRGKIGKAVIYMAGATVSLSTEAKRCGLV